MILSWQPPQPVEQLVSFCTSANSFSTSEKCALLCSALSMSAKVTCLQLQITVFSVYSILLEVAVKKALERAAVSCFVLGHFVDGVVDGVEVVLLGALGEVELALGGAEFAVDTPLEVVLRGRASGVRSVLWAAS